MSDSQGESTALVERSADAVRVPHVPIGTRDATQLHMVLDGAPVQLRPGRGRYSRSSYKVLVVHNGQTYRLRPKSPTASRLDRDGRQLGEFQREPDGEIKVWWEKGVEVSAADAALGYALAGAFGTGARLFFFSLLESSSAHAPG